MFDVVCSEAEAILIILLLIKDVDVETFWARIQTPIEWNKADLEEHFLQVVRTAGGCGFQLVIGGFLDAYRQNNQLKTKKNIGIQFDSMNFYLMEHSEYIAPCMECLKTPHLLVCTYHDDVQLTVSRERRIPQLQILTCTCVLIS